MRVRNEGRNSRWYSGSGIYRHVWLNTTGSVRVPLWGVFVTTPEVSKDSATVKVAVTIENRARGGPGCDRPHSPVRFEERAAAGTREARQSLAAGGSADVEQVFTVAAPQLWSTATPRLYRAEVELLADGKAADRVATPFGIRKVEVDAERGLRINGEPVKLKGGCLHHDNGLLGACAIDRAEERRVELMKAHGFNAIRTSHNPPSSAFLDACDRLGMLVMDEAFDWWERQKNAQDYHLYFNDWWQRDLDSMVLRDRNHPSVILWSIGNEIPERAEPRGVEIAKTAHRAHQDARPDAPHHGRHQRRARRRRGARPRVPVPGCRRLQLPAERRTSRTTPAIPKRVILGTESFPRQAFPSWRPGGEAPVRHRRLRVDRDGPPRRVLHRKCAAQHAGAADRGGGGPGGAGRRRRAPRGEPPPAGSAAGRPARRSRRRALQAPGGGRTSAP